VTFAPGTLPDGTLVTLQVFDVDQLSPPPAGFAIISHGINLQPEGVLFDPPAVITFHYSDADLGGEAPTELAVWVFINGGWQLLGGTVDPVRHTISISVSHFTLYAVMRSAGLPPAAPIEPPANLTPESGSGTGVTGVPDAGLGVAPKDDREHWVAIGELLMLAIGGAVVAAGMGRRRHR
jgi:hypothetical protein